MANPAHPRWRDWRKYVGENGEKYIDANTVRRAAEEKARLEGLVEGEARKPRWRRRVDSLRCLKGVDTASAADLVFEAGEFSRFRNARSFAAWVGLTPSEHSSGESDRRGAITKAGNKHLRKTLVEAAWHYLTCSGRPKDLAKGQAPDRVARRHAAKGVRRLVERREALLARGVHGCVSSRGFEQKEHRKLSSLSIGSAHAF